MFETIYNNLKGRVYSSLSFDHKCVVYAYEVFKTGVERNIAVEVMLSPDLTETFVDDQLEKVYGYKKDTIIGVPKEKNV